MKIREVAYVIKQHAENDPGVRTNGPEVLSRLKNQFRHGILMLDWEGSGTDCADPLALEQELDQRLAISWGPLSKAIVIEPELDAWVWGADNALKQILAWDEDLGIREWLADRGHEFHPNLKPVRPKEALEEIMRQLRKPRSSALYQNVALKVSLDRCSDPAFHRLKTTLRSWFQF